MTRAPHSAIEIVEVGPRDGLQNEPEIVAADAKVALIDHAARYGARRIEVGSFVNPRKVPQMADTEAVVAALGPRAGRAFSATGLCLNVRGVERALAGREGGGGVDEAGCVIVATDSFGVANQGQTLPDGLAANAAMIRLAKAGGMRAQVTIAASFGCPFEGEVPPARVLDIASRMIDAGADEIAFADTIGVAVPSQVSAMVATFLERAPAFPLRVHLHDTRGLGAANAWAAYQAGCRSFDSALGGLGGCPFAPKAAGNVATEELAYMFERSGIATGLDLAMVLEANAWFAEVMGRPLPSRVGLAGDFSPRDDEHSTAIRQREHA